MDGTVEAPARRSRGLAFVWSGLESASRQVLSFILSLAILAFVTPHDLGVYSVAFSLVLILALVVDTPVSEALIQRPDVTAEDWDTGFTVNLGISAALTGLSVLAAGLVARAFDEPDLAVAFPVMASCLIIGSIGNVQKAFLAREVLFGIQVRIGMLSNLAGGASSLALAVSGNGYLALVSNLIVTNIVSGALYWRASPWKPRLRIRRASVARLWAFAGSTFATQGVLLLRESALPLAIAQFGGVTLAGQFNLALRLSRTLGLLFEDVTRRPLFALMSRMHDRAAASAALLLNVVVVLGAVALPTFAGLALVGPALTVLLFGASWTQGATLLPLLCAIVLGWLTLHVPAVGLRARGEPGRAFAFVLVPTVIDLCVILLAIPFGVRIALTVMAVRAVLWLGVIGWTMQRWLGVTVRSVLRGLSLPALGVAAMAGVIALLRTQVGPGWMALSALIASGGAVYAAVVATGAAFGDRRLLSAVRALR